MSCLHQAFTISSPSKEKSPFIAEKCICSFFFFCSYRKRFDRTRNGTRTTSTTKSPIPVTMPSKFNQKVDSDYGLVWRGSRESCTEHHIFRSIDQRKDTSCHTPFSFMSFSIHWKELNRLNFCQFIFSFWKWIKTASLNEIHEFYLQKKKQATWSSAVDTTREVSAQINFCRPNNFRCDYCWCTSWTNKSALNQVKQCINLCAVTP